MKTKFTIGFLLFASLCGCKKDSSALIVTKTWNVPRVDAPGENIFYVEGHTSVTNYRLSCTEDKHWPSCFYPTAGRTYHIYMFKDATGQNREYSESTLIFHEQPKDTLVFTIEQTTAR